MNAIKLAVKFHELYEKYAPEYGYETKETTKVFNASSPNGKLMIRVCREIVADHLAALAEKERETEYLKSEIAEEIIGLQEQISVFEAREKMVIKAMQRGTELYEASHRQTVALPSYDKLACWLIEQITDLTAELKSLTEAYNNTDWKKRNDEQKEIVNNLTVRWGKALREIAALTTERDKLLLSPSDPNSGWQGINKEVKLWQERTEKAEATSAKQAEEMTKLQTFWEWSEKTDRALFEQDWQSGALE